MEKNKELWKMSWILNDQRWLKLPHWVRVSQQRCCSEAVQGEGTLYNKPWRQEKTLQVAKPERFLWLENSECWGEYTEMTSWRAGKAKLCETFWVPAAVISNTTGNHSRKKESSGALILRLYVLVWKWQVSSFATSLLTNKLCPTTVMYNPISIFGRTVGD